MVAEGRTLFQSVKVFRPSRRPAVHRNRYRAWRHRTGQHTASRRAPAGIGPSHHARSLDTPGHPLCLAGARIREMYQIGIVGGNVTVNVGALSYAGQLNIAVVGDPEAVPDLAVVAAGMADTLEQLGADVT